MTKLFYSFSQRIFGKTEMPNIYVNIINNGAKETN